MRESCCEEEVQLYETKPPQEFSSLSVYRVNYEATKENLIFTSSPARMCQVDYKEETFFDKPSFVQVVTYVVVTSRVLQPCPVQGYEGVHHLHHLHLCPDVQESQEDEQVARADDKPNEM